MQFTSQDIDAIVAQVLAQLQPAPTAVACPKREAVSSPTVEAVSAEVAIDDAVITGELLESKVKSQKRVRVRSGAVLTPSAKDVLRVRNIELVRGTASPGATSKDTLRTTLFHAPSTRKEVVRLRTERTGFVSMVSPPYRIGLHQPRCCGGAQ